MKLPERVANHITETKSFKIFSNNIPDEWVIREVTERDYGVDCYIEMVNEENQLTGELISIQLKGTNDLTWTQNGTHSFYEVKISTTNYWYQFPTPVFICLVDVKNAKVYFETVRSAVRKSYIKYSEQRTFHYIFKKDNELNINDISIFISAYHKEKKIFKNENNVITFISHYEQYRDFMDENYGRDLFLPVENQRVLYLKHMYEVFKNLCDFFDIEWTLKSMNEYSIESQKKFGTDEYLYEMDNDIIIDKLDELFVPLILVIKEYIIETEKEYWLVKDIATFNQMLNVRKDGKINYW